MRRTGALRRILVVSLSLFIEIAILGSFSPVRAGSYFGLEKGNTKRLELRHPLLLVQAEEGPTLKEVLEEKEKELGEQRWETEREISHIRGKFRRKTDTSAILLGVAKIGFVLATILYFWIWAGGFSDGIPIALAGEADLEQEKTEAFTVIGVDSVLDTLILASPARAGWLGKGPEVRVATIANMAKSGVFLYLILAEANKENPSPEKINNLTWGCLAGTVLIPFLIGTGYEIHYWGLRRKLKSKEEDLEEIEDKLRDLSFYYNPEKTRWEITYKIKF